MKKLLLILLILPIIVKAQVRPGGYKIKLASNRLYMELFNVNAVRAADDCNTTRVDCSTQAWEIIAVPGKPNTFHIVLVNGGKYLTWSNEPAVASRILLLPGYPIERIRFQSFLIIPNDKSSYDIQPALEGASANNYYLAAKLVSSGNNVVGIVNRNTVDWTRGDFSIGWLFTASDIITRLPVQTAQPGVVSTPAPKVTPLPVKPVQPGVVSPNNNKLDVDIKTGSDNLEMKPFQGNVDIKVLIEGKPDAILLNANKDQSWPNNSIKRVTIPLPADITVDQIKEIQISRLRKPGPTTTIFNIAEKDNWNVDGVIVNANIKTNNAMKRTKLLEVRSRGRVPGTTGHTIPYFRFVYLDGTLGANEGELLKLPLSPDANIIVPPPAAATIVVNPVIKIETLTGGDDLRGGNDNLNVLIRLKIRPVRNISLNNINNRQSWGNFTEHMVTRPISGLPFTFDDIEDIVLRHTGGGGMGADNWYLDKLKITLTIAGETRVLVDQVSAPIHYFKGDSRSKTFPIIR